MAEHLRFISKVDNFKFFYSPTICLFSALYIWQCAAPMVEMKNVSSPNIPTDLGEFQRMIFSEPLFVMISLWYSLPLRSLSSQSKFAGFHAVASQCFSPASIGLDQLTSSSSSPPPHQRSFNVVKQLLQQQKSETAEQQRMSFKFASLQKFGSRVFIEHKWVDSAKRGKKVLEEY